VYHTHAYICHTKAEVHLPTFATLSSAELWQNFLFEIQPTDNFLEKYSNKISCQFSQALLAHMNDTQAQKYLKNAKIQNLMTPASPSRSEAAYCGGAGTVPGQFICQSHWSTFSSISIGFTDIFHYISMTYTGCPRRNG